MRAVVTLVAVVLLLASLSAAMAACGSEEGESDELAARMEEEKAQVEEAIQAYMARTGVSEIRAREEPRKVDIYDDDAPFRGEMERIPTLFKYAWDVTGTVTAVVDPTELDPE
jgi:protein-disulfide isomerase